MRDMGRDRSTLTLCFLLALMCLSDSWLHFTSKLPMMIGLDIVAGWTLLLAIGIRFRYRASLEGLLLPLSKYSYAHIDLDFGGSAALGR